MPPVIPEVVYTTPLEPDPGDARLVLALVLMPASAFVDASDGAEVKATVRDALAPAKAQAIAKWCELQRSKP